MSGRRKAASRTRKRGESESQEGSPKLPPQKKVSKMAECTYCRGEVELGSYLECSMCQIKVCAECTGVSQVVISATQETPTLMTGFKWYCRSCEQLEPTWTAVSKKLDSQGLKLDHLESDNVTRMKGLETKIDLVEGHLTSEIKNSEMKTKIMVEMEIKKVEDSMETLVETNVQRLNADLTKLRDDTIKKEEFEAKMRTFLKEELDKRKISAGNNNTPGPSTSAGGLLSPDSQQREHVVKVTHEIQEKEMRKNRFILRGIRESGLNLISDRNKADKEYISTVLTDTLNIKVEEDSIIMANRLGEPREDENRAVMVTVSDARFKDRIFGSLHKLRGSVHDHLSFKHDMTITERLHFKKMVEASRRMEENDEGKHRYRVRGPPWNLNIIQLPPLAPQLEMEEDMDLTERGLRQAQGTGPKKSGLVSKHKSSGGAGPRNQTP